MRKRGEHQEQAVERKILDIIPVAVLERYWRVITILGIVVLLGCLAFWFAPKTPSVLNGGSGGEKAECSETEQDVYINWWFGIRHSKSCRSVDVLPLQSPDESTGVEDENKEHQNTLQDRPLTLAEADLLAQERMAYWTTWLAFLTALGLGALIWTLRLTRQTVDVTREIGDKQTRAYIDVWSAKMISPNSETDITWHSDRGIKAKILIKNFGMTPARNVKIIRSEKTIGKLLLDTFDTTPLDRQIPTAFTLAPNASIAINVDNILREEEWNEIGLENAYIMMLGHIEYEDVFNVSHFTDFCLRLENFGTDRMRIFPYTRGNQST